MFLNKEQREAKKQQEEEQRILRQQQQEHVDQLELQLRQLNQNLENRTRAYDQVVADYKQSVTDKWEYLSVSDKFIDKWKNLDNLGALGWELVGISTYAEGYEVKTIYTQYVLKRKLPRIPEDIIQPFLDIPDLIQQSEVLKSQIARAKRG